MVNSKHEKNIFLVYLFVFLHRISIIAHIDIIITVLANFRASHGMVQLKSGYYLSQITRMSLVTSAHFSAVSDILDCSQSRFFT